MASKFLLVITLFLTLAALALPPSQLGARLARGEDIQPQPSEHSPSIIPRIVNEPKEDLAGCQYHFFGVPADFGTVTIKLPWITPSFWFNISEMTIGMALGDMEPRCNSSTGIILVGVRISVVYGRIDAYPVWGTNLQNIQRIDGNYAAMVGDTITLVVHASSMFGTKVQVKDHDGLWTAVKYIPHVQVENGCASYYAEIMVIATRLPPTITGESHHLPLPYFRGYPVDFLHVLFHYPNGVPPPLNMLRCFDMTRGTALPIAHTEPGIPGGLFYARVWDTNLANLKK